MRRVLVIGLFILGALGCSERERTTLEFRIAEHEPAPGLTGIVFPPTGERFHLHDEVLLNQADVDSAFVTIQGDRPVVELVFTDAGADKFERLTGENIGKRCAVFLNGELVTAPRIMAAIHVGRAVLTGDFSEAEARDVARNLSRP